jgi:hypothetical protein
MRFTRVAATLVLAFLFGGGAAETFLKARDAIERKRAPTAEGSTGELVSLALQDQAGEMIARPRVVVTPGRPVEMVLRDPEDPAQIRLAFHIETERQPSGLLLVGYRIAMPLHAVETSGRICVTPGVEQPIDLGELPFGATIFTIPVPSPAFDAYLEFERARSAITRI